MDTQKMQDTQTPLALWGGLECTVNRVQQNYYSQM